MICLILLVNCCFNSAGVAASIVSSQSSSPGDAHEPILASSSNLCIGRPVIPPPYATYKDLMPFPLNLAILAAV